MIVCGYNYEKPKRDVQLNNPLRKRGFGAIDPKYQQKNIPLPGRGRKRERERERDSTRRKFLAVTRHIP